MATYKVLKVFYDLQTQETYQIGKVIEPTDERFKEMVDALEEFGGGFLEEFSEENDTEETKEEKPKKKAKAK